MRRILTPCGETLESGGGRTVRAVRVESADGPEQANEGLGPRATATFASLAARLRPPRSPNPRMACFIKQKSDAWM